jgi:selenocysteine lyase/cysteine desulfurase
MKLSRRDWLKGAGALPLASPLARLSAQAPAAGAPALPDKAAFAHVRPGYLDSGTMHPMSVGARAAVDAYLAAREAPGSAGTSVDEERILGNFARLINADPDEVAFVKSTTTGEHLIVNGLGLFEGAPHVVTDTLHFFGSFPLYESLAARGARVTWLRPRDNRIAIEDIARAITPETKLVALSLVSTFNGFHHDLARVCELAHAKGALVYADIIHAAGCVPVDVKASGVDFAACASYKWLMGDFGLGFVYARREALARLLPRRFGYYGVASFQPHVYPFDPPGARAADFTMRDDATGRFATGTFPHSVARHVDHSLDYLLGLGVERINAHARPLVDRLKEELPRRGYTVVTPRESPAPMVTCAFENARTLAPRLEAAGLRLTVSRNRFRITPSVFNDMDDVERLLAALHGARPA